MLLDLSLKANQQLTLSETPHTDEQAMPGHYALNAARCALE